MNLHLAHLRKICRWLFLAAAPAFTALAVVPRFGNATDHPCYLTPVPARSGSAAIQIMDVLLMDLAQDRVERVDFSKAEQKTLEVPPGVDVYFSPRRFMSGVPSTGTFLLRTTGAASIESKADGSLEAGGAQPGLATLQITAHDNLYESVDGPRVFSMSVFEQSMNKPLMDREEEEKDTLDEIAMSMQIKFQPGSEPQGCYLREKEAHNWILAPSGTGCACVIL